MLYVFEATERAFWFNFTCFEPRNANGAPEWSSDAFRLTLTTDYKK